MGTSPTIDVHQHLWPEPLVDRLRARRRAPYLRDWTLHTQTEPAYDVDPLHHDIESRIGVDRLSGVDLACVSMSAPLGVEYLPPPEAQALLAAWHQGARALPGHFAAWASVPALEPDLDELAGLLHDGFVGVQLPATALLSPPAWERAGSVLRVAEEAGKPVFVHPGPEVAPSTTDQIPDWWIPVVGYVSQMQASWWAWQAVRGRQLFPSLRVLFGAGAGLAPLHHERHVARGGESRTIDHDVFVDTSSYGPQALDALARALGIDVLTLGSDRPYGDPIAHLLGDAATHAIRVVNPHRMLTGEDPRTLTRTEGPSWRRAS